MIAAGFPTPTSQSCVGYLCVSHSTNPTSVAMSDAVETTLEFEPDAHAGELITGPPDHVVAVSYTHPTLPPNRELLISLVARSLLKKQCFLPPTLAVFPPLS